MYSPAMPIHEHPFNGRVCEVGVSQTDRNFAVAMHLSPFASLLGIGPFALLIPLVLWLVRKDESAFSDDHGREAVNAILSFFLWHVVLLITVVGVLLWPVLWILAFVNLIRAAMAGSRGEYFRYPMTVRFV